MKKRILSVALTFAMALSLIPMVNATAFSAAASEKYPDKVWDVPDGKLYAVGSTIEDSEIVPGKIGAKLNFTGDSSGSTGWASYKKMFEENKDIYAFYGYYKGKFYYHGNHEWASSFSKNFGFELADDETLTFITDSKLWIKSPVYATGGTFKIELRDDADFSIYLEDLSGAYYGTKDPKGNEYPVRAGLYVMNNGSLEISGNGSIYISYGHNYSATYLNAYYGVCAGSLTIKDEAGLRVKLISRCDNSGKSTSAIYVKDSLTIDTTDVVSVSFEGSSIEDLYSFEFASPATVKVNIKNARSINLQSGLSKNNTKLGTYKCKFSDVFRSGKSSDNARERYYLDDAFEIVEKGNNYFNTTKVYREKWSRPVDTKSTVTIGGYKAYKKFKRDDLLRDDLEQVYVNGGEYLPVKCFFTLPEWLEKLYKEGRVKIGEDSGLFIYGSYGKKITSDNMPGYMTAINVLGPPEIGYETTNFKPVTKDDYFVVCKLSIVSSQGGHYVAEMNSEFQICAVEKASKTVWDKAPVKPMLSYDKVNKKVEVDNSWANQQYLLSEKAMDDTELLKSSKWNKLSSFKVSEGKFYYIYTRMMETDDHFTGTVYRYSTITTADKVYLNKVTLEGYASYGPNNTVYIEQGKTIDIPVVMEPSNANVWSEFEFKSPTPETSFAVISPKDRVAPGTEIKSITVKGNNVGSGLLGAYKGNNDNYGQWRIVVYDPNNITDYRFVDPPVYSDTTLTVGSTHMPERSISEINKTKLTDPAGALKDKALEWRVMKPAQSMVGTPTYVLDNGYISIDKNTGKVTAKAANTAADISGHYKTAALCVVNSSGSVSKQVSSYKVSVNAAQAVGPEAGKPEGGAPGDVTPGGAAGGSIGEGVTDVSLFSDVPSNAYYKDAVKWAVEKNITSGKSKTTFAPDNKCDRAQAVTFLWRAAGSPAPESKSMPFADVAAGSYYYDAVLWALENGVTQGVSDTMFGPDRSCSRGQIATFIWRSQKSPVGGGANPFIDVSDSDYYAEAVSWAVGSKVTNGTAADTFSPGSSCTRAQIVTFIFRALS